MQAILSSTTVRHTAQRGTFHLGNCKSRRPWNYLFLSEMVMGCISVTALLYKSTKAYSYTYVKHVKGRPTLSLIVS